MRPLKAAEAIVLIEGDVTDVKAAHFWSWEVAATEHVENESAPGTGPWELTLQPSHALTP